MDYTVHGILQARILQWVAFPSPEDFPNPGIEPRAPALQVDSLPAEPQEKSSYSIGQYIFFLIVNNYVQANASNFISVF